MCRPEGGWRTPVYTGYEKSYYEALGTVEIASSLDTPDNYQSLPRQYVLPLLMLSDSLTASARPNPGIAASNTLTEQNISPTVIQDALLPENISAAFELEGLIEPPHNCLGIPLSEDVVLYIPGRTAISTDNERVDQTIHTTFYLSNGTLGGQFYLVESYIEEGSEQFSTPEIYRIEDADVAHFYGWNVDLIEDALGERDVAAEVEITSEERVNKYAHVAQGVLRGVISSPFASLRLDADEQRGDILRDQLLDRLIDVDVRDLTTIYHEGLGLSGKSVGIGVPRAPQEDDETLENPYEGDWLLYDRLVYSSEDFVTATLLEKSVVKVNEKKGYRESSYFLILKTTTPIDGELVESEEMFKITRRIEDATNTYTTDLVSLGPVEDLEDEKWWEVPPPQFELLRGEDYIPFILEHLPEVEGVIAIKGMMWSLEDPKIRELIDALIAKKEKFGEEIEIILPFSKSSIRNRREAEIYNEMYEADITLINSDTPRELPRKGRDHEKMFVLGDKCGVGGVNFEGSSAGFIDWMLVYNGQPAMRDLLLNKIRNESAPYTREAMGIEFGLYNLTHGLDGMVPTDSHEDLAEFVEEAFVHERVGYISENALTDSESAIIDAAVLMIDQATDRVQIMGQWLPDGKVREALLSAMARGVQVDIISNSMWAHGNDAIPGREKIDKVVYGGLYLKNYLLWMGIKRRAKRRGIERIDKLLRIITTDKKLVHAKVLRVDDKVIIIGSDNFIKSGADSGARENCLIVSTEEVVAAMGQEIDNVLGNEAYEWMYR